jgi:pyruvate formate lyase activating enzyme
MIISGLQKLTLIDYPEKLACTIFLYGCNFRCGFCHNPELVVEENKAKYSKEEILDFLKKRKKYLDGVCITGGEPLMSLEKNFLKEIKDLGYLIKIDTNGGFPEKLRELIDEGLISYVAMDIKSCKEDYEKVACVEVPLEKIEESVKIISNSGIDYEFRTTILKRFHNKENVKKISRWLNEILGRKPKKFILQSFKNQGKVIDKNFLSETNVCEEDLNYIIEGISDDFEKIEVRV